MPCCRSQLLQDSKPEAPGQRLDLFQQLPRDIPTSDGTRSASLTTCGIIYARLQPLIELSYLLVVLSSVSGFEPLGRGRLGLESPSGAF